MYDNVQVIIPSLNPDEKLASTAAGMIEKGFTDVILVDDGSNEECRKEFEKIKEKYPDNITVLVHEVNKGKGRAMKTAFEYVLKERKDSQGVVTVDGDTALLTGSTTLEAKVYGVSGTWTLKTNQHFVKQDGKWLLTDK